MNVPGAFISPCSMTLLTKPLKGVLQQFRYSYSGSTLVWKYGSLKSILLRYLDRPSAFRIVLCVGICWSSFLVLSFRAVRSTRGLILPSGFPWTNNGAAPGNLFPIYDSFSFLLSKLFLQLELILLWNSECWLRLKVLLIFQLDSMIVFSQWLQSFKNRIWKDFRKHLHDLFCGCYCRCPY